MGHGVKLSELVEKMELKNLTPTVELKGKEVSIPEVNRPALQLSGFFDHFDSDRVQIIGYVEYTYLQTLDYERKIKIYDELVTYKVPCIVYSRNLEPDKELIEKAAKQDIPIFQTEKQTSGFMAELIRWMNVKLAPCISIHGVLVDVYGVGVLIMGESGIGKSEAALELIKRGHRLVTDDVVEIRKVSDETLVGSAPDITRHFIELRGIGIVDVKSMVGVIVVVMFGVIPQLTRTMGTLMMSIADFVPQMQRWIREFSHNNREIMELVNQLQFNSDQAIKWGISLLGNGAGNMMNTTMSAVGSIVSGLATFFIAFSFACYVLFQKEKLHVQVRKVFFAFLPKQKADSILKVCSLTYRTFANFLTGQCLEAVILGSMFCVILSILRMPYALLIGVLIAFTALVPIFGAFIGCAVGTFLIFMVSPKQAVLFIIVFLVLQQIEGNLIYPHVVGESVGLPSIWVLAAVTIGGNLMGIVGMLIFIPLLSVFYTIFREFVYLRLKKQHIKQVTEKEIFFDKD